MASFINLSATDAALFKSLQASALFPTLAQPGKGELVQLFKQKRREEEIKKVAPYADLLEIVLKQQLRNRKDSILKQLRESDSSTFKVELFSWKTVHYFEALSELNERVDAMTDDERAAHSQKMRARSYQIQDNGWESTFAVEATTPSNWGTSADDYEEQTYFTYYPMKVDRIFRNSDLAWRLSLTLGPNFFPSYRWDRVEGAGDSDEQGFHVYKKTLYVTYCPFGVKNAHMAKLLAVAKKDAERISLAQKIGFHVTESGVGHKDLCVIPEPEDEYADMPPLVPAPVRRPWMAATEKWGGEHLCFCGCGDESE